MGNVLCSDLVFGSHQVVDDVRAGGVASSVAEPLLAHVAHHHTGRVVDRTVLARKHWQFLSANYCFIQDKYLDKVVVVQKKLS